MYHHVYMAGPVVSYDISSVYNMLVAHIGQTNPIILSITSTVYLIFFYITWKRTTDSTSHAFVVAGSMLGRVERSVGTLTPNVATRVVVAHDDGATRSAPGLGTPQPD